MSVNKTSMSATDVAAATELFQTNQTALAAATTPGDPPMAGFSSGVHQYLNQLLTLIYSRTTTLLASNMVLVSLLLSTRSSTLLTLAVFYVGSVFFFSLSAIVSTLVLFPRFHHHDNEGLIFWRSILSKGGPDDYKASIQALNKAAIEDEYAKDNWHIAQTIRYKDALVRCAIMLFVLGLSCAVIGVVIPAVFKTH